jgi:hypothetical protein
MSAAGGREFHCVEQQVPEYLLQAPPVRIEGIWSP